MTKLALMLKLSCGLFLVFQQPLQAVDCPVNIGDLRVLENPVNVPKTANSKITTLQIEEQQHLGSLTCHVLRDTSKPIFDKFNATTNGLAFSNAGVYDPYDFGKKRKRFYNCDIYLTDANFEALAVDLEIVLILQPLLRRQGINICDVPLITRQTLRIEFEGYQGPPASTTRQPFVFTTILRKTSFKIENFTLRPFPATTSTRRQPKVVPQFATTSPIGSQGNYLVDGFDVGAKKTTSSTASTPKREIQNRDLSNQGVTRSTPEGPRAILQESSTTASVLGAGPGLNGQRPVEKPSTDNPVLFWVILAIILIFAFMFVMAVIYYCFPSLCVPCFGEGYLTKSFTGGMHGPLGTAKDLTFVSVLDKDGRPLRHASTVEVWNTQKNNIKTYPIINGGEQVTSKTDNYAIFTNATGHLGHAETRQRRDFILTSDDHETIESGDRVTLVDRQGKESPVLVRILRAVTPKTFSARLARSRWKSPPDAYDKEPPRIFEIVREDHGDGRQAVTLEQRSSSNEKDVQILTLEDDQETKRGETFRRENGAEILELEEDEETVEDLVNDELKLTQRTRLEVLKEDSDEELIRSELATAEMEAEAVAQQQRKVSDNKEQQTDLTYAHVNKKIQTNTMEEDEQNSDIDMADEESMTDAASSVLSQSIRSTHSYHGGDPNRYYRYKKSTNPSLEEVGFLNVAMHHLVQDEFQRGRRPQAGGNVGNRRSRSQVDYVSDDSSQRYIIHRKSMKKRSDGNINYYDGNRTPPTPAYNETKASILRRRKNHKPNENEEEDLEEVLRPSLQQYASLQDLARLQMQHQNQGLPFSKHQSTTSLNQPAKLSKKLLRQNSDSAVVQQPSSEQPLGIDI